ncbi:integrase [Bradyrhizobium ottawaense]|uniref:tyrosine-type recombinase/integrase n=1 Tax=Bradyrhizobium ottawaense TaxID=931866 RepID=UPI001BADD3C8|nr:tyrosine-type recombinase/integrase [Bradyrhizobium ottawaense]MBR1362802.1 tyrosine-type recombinase/integrase [Bradyrhizobium ottawaense]
MARPPKYVHGFIDRHGKPRFYFRRPGFKKVALPGLPWSPEFMAKYHQATSTKPVTSQIGADKVVARSLRALAIAYYESPAFKALDRDSTQGVYRNIIDKLCRETDKDGQPYGDKSAVTLKSHHIEKMMDERAAKPDSANGLRKVLREMMKVAKKLGWREDDPTQGVKKLKPKKKAGFHRWTDIEIATFEKRHPVGSRARLAMALGLYTGQARQDVVLMGEQHITEEVLDWVRKKTEDKTGLELAIPVHPELRRIINATPSRHLTFLVTELGAPFTAAGFGNWFRDRCNEAGLKHCAFHGLRKAAATRLVDAGCDVVEAAAITGHASLKELQRYIETRDRRRAARRAMDKLISRTEVSNPPARFDHEAKKA